VTIYQDLDTIVFVIIGKSIRNISLNSSNHLLKSASHTLLSVFNDTSDVAIGASILLTEFVTIV
jgi:hypothetical protein